MASKPTLQDMLFKKVSLDYTPSSAAAEILLLIVTGPEGKRSAGFSARVLELMGYIAQEMNKSENVHRALRPEFARIVEASDICPPAPPGAVSGGASPKS